MYGIRIGNVLVLTYDLQVCLASGRLKTAASYLLVLHNLEQLEDGRTDVVRLLRASIGSKDWQLCKELLRFLHSIDETGTALRNALSETELVGSLNGALLTNGEAHSD